jgi:polyhydroxyalkanoate synthesis regulator phasin
MTMVTDPKAQAQDATKTAPDATKTMQDTKKRVKAERPRISKAAGKLMLASIGAVGLAQDWIEHTMDRMVERGEVSQKQARRRMNELRARGEKVSRTGMDKMGETMEEAADLPTKADIQSLHDQIADLSAKVEELSKEKKAPTP